MRLKLGAVLVLVFATIGLAQKIQTSVPDFTGTWELDLKKSSLRGGDGLERRVVVIEHDDPLVKLSWTTINHGVEIKYVEILYADKRKEDNDGTFAMGMFTSQPSKSQSFWQKRTLTRQYLFGAGLMRGGSIRELKIDRTRYSISDDGQKLTLITFLAPSSLVGSPSMGPSTPQFSTNMTEKEVFNKK